MALTGVRVSTLADENAAEEEVFGPCGGSVLIHGYASEMISVADFKDTSLALMERWKSEIQEFELKESSIDIDVTDLVMPQLEKITTDTMKKLWPQSNSENEPNTSTIMPANLEKPHNPETSLAVIQLESSDNAPQTEISEAGVGNTAAEKFDLNQPNFITFESVMAEAPPDFSAEGGESERMGNIFSEFEGQAELGVENSEFNFGSFDFFNTVAEEAEGNGEGVEAERSKEGSPAGNEGEAAEKNNEMEKDRSESESQNIAADDGDGSGHGNVIISKRVTKRKGGRYAPTGRMPFPESERKKLENGSISSERKKILAEVDRVIGIAKRRESSWALSELNSVREMSEGKAAEEDKSELVKLSVTRDIQVEKRGNHFIISTFKKKLVAMDSDPPPMADSELLLLIQFMDPSKTETKSQVMLVRANQKLTAVRDAIYCPHDIIARHASMSVPSAYFCMEDVFCSDMRHPEASDYSEALLAWSVRHREAVRLRNETARKKQPLPPVFRSCRMEDTCFADLSVRVGVNYVYFHQDGCKHLFLISEIRVLHPSDVMNPGFYPIITYRQPLLYRKCVVCAVMVASKVVYGSRFLPESPSFMCQECYNFAHYREDGSLHFEDFSVFEYVHE